MDRHRLLQQQLAAKVVGMKADYAADPVGQHESVSQVAQRFRGLANGKTVTVAFQQAPEAGRVAIHVVEFVQDHAHAAVTPSREKRRNHVCSHPGVEFEVSEVRIKDADFLFRQRQNGAYRPLKGGASIEQFIKAVRHGVSGLNTSPSS